MNAQDTSSVVAAADSLAEDACNALHEVVQAHGRIIKFESRPPADLANPFGVMSYLLSLGVPFFSPLDRLATAVEFAVSRVHEAANVDPANHAARLAIANAINDLDRALARELYEAESVLKDLATWIGDAGRRFDIKAVLKRSGAEPASMGLVDLAIASLRGSSEDGGSVAQLVRSGCTLPPELALQICKLPFHGAAALHESVLVWLESPDHVGEDVPSSRVTADRMHLFGDSQHPTRRRRYT